MQLREIDIKIHQATEKKDVDLLKAIKLMLESRVVEIQQRLKNMTPTQQME